MPTLNVFTPGNPEALFNSIASPNPQYTYGHGLEVKTFDYGNGIFQAEGLRTQFNGSFQGHFDDEEWYVDSGTVTSLRTMTGDGYPLVEITDINIDVFAAFSQIVSVTAAQLRTWMESQSWTINGSAGNDTLMGGNKDDEIIAHSGGDIVNALNGNDILEGGSGADTLVGGTGKDWIDGGKGVDLLTGNAGKDTFVYASGYGKDTITDFVNGIDQIDISDWKGFKNFEDVKDHLERSDEDVIIKDGSEWLTITNTVKADLDETDFIF
jgi:Ca2+-binding RTX toxin-like protein